MTIYNIELPDTFTVSAPSTIGGGTFTFSTPEILKVIDDVIRNGLQQKFSDKVADKKQQAIYNVPGGVESLGHMFAERFSAGIWNEKSGGGPRLDPMEAFVRQRAIAAAKAAMKAKKLDLSDDKLLAEWRDKALSNEAWLTATRAQYVPVIEINID